MKDLLIPVRLFERQPGQCHLPKAVTLSSVHAADALPLAQLRDDLAVRKRSARVAMGVLNTARSNGIAFPLAALAAS